MKKPIPFGKYYLLERINVGGMAEVFRAKAYGVEGFERLVAVKRILPNIAEDKDFIRMFIDEAKIAVQLNHANIAQIFDLGVVDTHYYIALEHIHGRDLRAIFDRCRQRGGGQEAPGEPMPIAQACFVTMKVCEGLDYAHNKRDQTGRELNLVHRDVSPQNVLVSFEGEVKLIDFGIAKAAGKGSKTQAGILKGKFGYMSPEQVRGLPIDRRSDVFSAGIVLYELLTGERLFVGESDFSTLEKVRNVEILPPSTYNRRIPDELERIVLKALAKDPEERYQNGIDLHDELQAFVYTAGEFYSRKDLAGWMKATFAAEIEDETAKLESFRHMSAPDGQGEEPGVPSPPAPQPIPLSSARRTSGAQSAESAQPARRATLSMPAVVPMPPGARPSPPRVTAGGRRSGPLAAQEAPVTELSPAPVAPRVPEVGAQEPLEWDDDELETSIYADKDDVKGGVARAGQQGMSAAAVAAAPAPAEVSGDPDLSTLAPTARAWPPPAVGANAAHGGAASNGAMPRASSVHDAHTIDHRRPARTSRSMPAVSAPRDSSAVVELAALAASRPQPQTVYRDTMAEPLSFGTSFLSAHERKRSWPRLGINFRALLDLKPSTVALIAVTAVVGVVVVLLIYMVTGHKGGDRRARGEAVAAGAVAPGAGKTAPASAPAPRGGSARPAAAAASAGAAAGAAAISVDPASGFDLIVDPAGVRIKLDGRAIGKAPLQIRNLVEGNHLVEVEAPPGFFNKSQTVQVARGKAQRVVMKLDAMDVIGKFTSEPPGAKVILLVDGEKRSIGVSPVEARLDPRKRYDVVFRRDGYEPATRQVAMTGGNEVQVAAVLDRAQPGQKPVDERVAAAAARRPRAPAARDAVELPRDDAAEPAGEGMLGLSSKPPCRIFIDGRDIGQKTPQVGLKLKAGRHRVTLINNEFGLKESFVVEIQAGETVKAIKDLTDRLPPGEATPTTTEE
ncbi:MAG TPA: protein kinase [Kofleriaceae bacterium]|nr:protein kinase [Kofleriaceae bacterium]